MIRNPHRRYLLLNIWSFGLPKETMEEFRAFVDAAKAARFDIVRFNLHWHHLEPVPGRYEFSNYDERIGYIVDQGMAVGINVDVRVVGRAMLVPPDGLVRTADGQLFRDGESHMLAFAHETSMQRACDAVAAVAARYSAKCGDRIAFFQVTNTPCCELEYWHGKLLDYGEPASWQWRSWLTTKYGDIAGINAALGTAFATLRGANPPVSQSGLYGEAWFRYRSGVLGTAIRRFSATITAAAAANDYSIQWGSVWDAAAGNRGSLLFPQLSGPAQWVTVDDAPGYDHAFSADLLRSNSPVGQILGNEIDHPSMADDETYFSMAKECYDHGLNLMSVANWDPKTLRERTKTLFHPLAELRDQSVTQPGAHPPTMRVSVRELLAHGPDATVKEYRRISGEGRELVEITLVDDLVGTDAECGAD